VPISETETFLTLALANRWNGEVLARIEMLGLADWWLTAGCLAHPLWNARHGLPPEHGIVDYDVFYFDQDTSWEAEDAMIRRAAAACADVPITLQIRNQARVPLWYEAKLGVPYPQVHQASDGIDRFPCISTAVGAKREAGALRVYAPYGLSALLAGRLVPNRALDIPEVYRAKTARWREIWPGLVVEGWVEREVLGGDNSSIIKCGL
jgi:hypothetical protein